MGRDYNEVKLNLEWPEAEDGAEVVPHNLKKIVAGEQGESLENIEFGYVTIKGRIMTVYTREGEDARYDSVIFNSGMTWWALYNAGAGMRPKLGCPKCDQ